MSKIQDVRKPDPRVVIWVAQSELTNLLDAMKVRPDEWDPRLKALVTQLDLVQPKHYGRVHVPEGEGTSDGWVWRFNDYHAHPYHGIMVNCVTNPHWKNLVNRFPMTEVFYTSVGERTLDSEYSIWWLNALELHMAQRSSDEEGFRHEALIQFLDSSFVSEPPVKGVNIADGLGYVVKALDITPPDPSRDVGILMFSEGTPYLPHYGLVQQLSIMDMSEKGELATPPLTPIETHTRFLDALDKEARETIQASGSFGMTVDSAVRGFQKRVIQLIAGGSNDIGPCGLIPLYHTADQDMLLPGERQGAYQGEIVDIDEWRLRSRVRYPSTTKAYHLTHDQFKAAVSDIAKRYVGRVTVVFGEAVAQGHPRSIAAFDTLYELAETALNNKLYVNTEQLGMAPTHTLEFMSDDWDKVNDFAKLVQERGHRVTVTDYDKGNLFEYF